MSNITKTPVVSKKVLVPFILVTSLFALWGFANAVTDPMVNAFKKVLELSNVQASWVQMAFYGGYFCMALPAAMFMRKYSYKVGVLIGLGLYAGGALLFYPAAITEQFWFFCLGLYVLTFGLAFLETAANPYILAMGAKETATQRLNLAQSVNPVGLIAGLLVAKYFVYDKLQSDDIADFSALDDAKRAMIKVADLAVIRDPYVVLGLVILAVFVLFLVNKMPQSKEEGVMPSLGDTFGTLLGNSKYVLGVVAQILYVGAQIMTWTYIYQYAEAIDLANADVVGYEKIDVFAYQFIAFVLFTVGRIVGTAMLRFMSSGKLLMFFAILAGACVASAMFIEGIVGLYSVVGISFCMSLMFPTIYGIALGDLTEEQSKVGSAGLVMAIVGGALLPMLQGMIIDAGGSGVADTKIMGVAEVNFSFVLPLICFAYIAWYGFHVFRKHEEKAV
ncbi:L-fucose:H+ symporter permease [Algibacter amylolyticus]|uniref:L-fucose:H+ symporter permease n=1 Tax=Algibacter amylolyticus TaxID=1608400 RepID=A0A5M7B125_9FLAO|nr:L-fucose:H+ symporter permease [Algibacter amylolyticus]KAA5821887.1 L-fucose:H+ symporter permease [Algibacter amylolyticus]MBB5269315.1 FHS family L-fucose permease-like MFS transporter [Algibacter amylolyticus]TSJ73171.1 L-fucose:H+ symporter permease [Algibacter amylolyticus]